MRVSVWSLQRTRWEHCTSRAAWLLPRSSLQLLRFELGIEETSAPKMDEVWGRSSAWKSTGFASRGSWVRVPSSPQCSGRGAIPLRPPAAVNGRRHRNMAFERPLKLKTDLGAR